MPINNRQIKTDHAPKQSTMKMEVLKEVTLGGVKMKVGEVFQATRSEARRLMIQDKNMFKILLD